jgi:hypothetical protein
VRSSEGTSGAASGAAPGAAPDAASGAEVAFCSPADEGDLSDPFAAAAFAAI